jgi:sugar transferase (PEP-CTERM/EpsH1 system associated)
MSQPDRRPLIAHVMHRFDYGGLENGVVNVVNGLPEQSFRHAIIAMTEASDFKQRLKRSDVSVHTLNKKPGKDPSAYFRLYSLLRKLKPTVVHTRNLAAIEGALVARLAGVPLRSHGEHGWDVYDPDGSNKKYRALRRFMNPAIHRFVSVSKEIEKWLVTTVGIPAGKVMRICNGVDTQRFHPTAHQTHNVLPPAIFSPGTIAVGSVTRFSEIKDPFNLVRAFIEARRSPAGQALRLAMAGDGPMHAGAVQLLREAQMEDVAWLPGSRDDVPQILSELDVYVLGSRREGISNTVLESMASSLPVIATAVGGNLELVEDGANGRLVPPGDSAAMAQALIAYAADPALRARHGRESRARAEREYSLRRMLSDYESLYRNECIRLGEAA